MAEPPGALALWRAYIGSYARHGNDPYVGRRLVSLLHQAGAAPARNTWIFFGGCSGSPDFRALVENLIGLLIGARHELLADRAVSERVFEQGIEALREWGRRPDAAFWFARCWAEGVRPRGGADGDPELPRAK